MPIHHIYFRNFTESAATAVALTGVCAAAVKYSGHVYRFIQTLEKIPLKTLAAGTCSIVVGSALMDIAIRFGLSKIAYLRNNVFANLASSLVSLSLSSMAGYALISYNIIPLALSKGLALIGLGVTGYCIYKLVATKYFAPSRPKNCIGNKHDIVATTDRINELLIHNPFTLFAVAGCAFVEELLPDGKKYHADHLWDALQDLYDTFNNTQFAKDMSEAIKWVQETPPLMIVPAAVFNNTASLCRWLMEHTKKQLNNELHRIRTNIKRAPSKPNFIHNFIKQRVEAILQQHTDYQLLRKKYPSDLTLALEYKNSISWSFTFIQLLASLRIGEFAVRSLLYPLLFVAHKKGKLDKSTYDFLYAATPAIAKLLVAVEPHIRPLHNFDFYVKHAEDIEAIIKNPAKPNKEELTKKEGELFNHIIFEFSGEKYTQALDAAFQSVTTI